MIFECSHKNSRKEFLICRMLLLDYKKNWRKEVRIANDPTEQKIVHLGGTVLQTFEYAKVKHLSEKTLDGNRI